MIKLIRISAVVAILWSLIVTGVLWIIGLALEHADMFNGPHTRVLAVVSLLEIALLCILVQACRLRFWAAAALLIWFVLASAVHTSPIVLRDWAEAFMLLLIVLAPVTLTMILLAVYGFSSSPRNVRNSKRSTGE